MLSLAAYLDHPTGISICYRHTFSSGWSLYTRHTFRLGKDATAPIKNPKLAASGFTLEVWGPNQSYVCPPGAALWWGTPFIFQLGGLR